MLHISNVLEGYTVAQQRVIDCQRVWHDFPTAENLTAWVDAQETLIDHPVQMELPVVFPEPEIKVYGLW